MSGNRVLSPKMGPYPSSSQVPLDWHTALVAKNHARGGKVDFVWGPTARQCQRGPCPPKGKGDPSAHGTSGGLARDQPILRAFGSAFELGVRVVSQISAA